MPYARTLAVTAESLLTPAERQKAKRLVKLHREELRRRARNDPNAWMEYVWRGDDGQYLRQAALHRELQMHLSTHQKALVRFPREHGKSTQIFGRAVWELAHNHNMRIKVVCANDDLAQRRVGEMRRLIENPLCRRVFPDLKPQHSEWTKHHFNVRRTANLLDHSVEAYGVLSGATGGRCDLLVLDDVCDDKNSLYSSAMREAVVEAVRNKWLNLVTGHGRIWWPGTPWHFDDAFHQRCKEPHAFALLDRKIDAHLNPLWPEHWPRDRLETHRVEIGPRAFARGFHCFPMATEEQIFQLEWFQWWRPGDLPTAHNRDPDDDRLYLDLDFYMGVDPAFSEKQRADETAMVVIGIQGKRKFVVDAVHRRGLSRQGLVTEAMRLIRKWHPYRCWVETNAAQIWVADAIREAIDESPDLETRVRGEPTTAKTGDKDARMALLADQFEAGYFFLRGNGPGKPHKSQEVLYQQLTQFPNGDHDDLCDALDFAWRAAPKGGESCPIRFAGAYGSV